MAGGLRYNEGKRRWGLLSWPALGELVKVLEFGARKYDSWNWSKGLSWSECFESMQRHATAWYCGEDRDPETGLSHMAHVLCNAMFLVHFILWGTGKDDRPTALAQERNENNKKEQDDGTTKPIYESRYEINRAYPVESSGLSHIQEDVRSEDRQPRFTFYRD